MPNLLHKQTHTRDFQLLSLVSEALSGKGLTMEGHANKSGGFFVFFCHF